MQPKDHNYVNSFFDKIRKIAAKTPYYVKSPANPYQISYGVTGEQRKIFPV